MDHLLTILIGWRIHQSDRDYLWLAHLTIIWDIQAGDVGDFSDAALQDLTASWPQLCRGGNHMSTWAHITVELERQEKTEECHKSCAHRSSSTDKLTKINTCCHYTQEWSAICPVKFCGQRITGKVHLIWAIEPILLLARSALVQTFKRV